MAIDEDLVQYQAIKSELISHLGLKLVRLRLQLSNLQPSVNNLPNIAYYHTRGRVLEVMQLIEKAKAATTVDEIKALL